MLASLCRNMPRQLRRQRLNRHPSKLGAVGRDCPSARFSFVVMGSNGRTSLKNLFRVRASSGLVAVFLLSALACNSQPGGDVMATVDGRKIFRSDVDKYYDNQIASAQQPPTGEQATALRLNILHQMIEDEIVMRRAEKLGLLATDDEVDKKYNEIKSPASEDEFQKRLKEKKISLADFKRDIRRSITLEKVID